MRAVGRLLVACLAAGTGFYPGPPLWAGTAAPVFTVVRADGKSSTGPLRKIGPDWSVWLAGASPDRVVGEDVLALRQAETHLPPLPDKAQLVLTNGDRIPLDRQAGVRVADEFVYLQPLPPLRAAAGEQLKVPLSRAAILWLASPVKGQAPGKQMRRLLRAQRRQDQVQLQGGDQVVGTVLALDPGAGCRLRSGRQQQTVPYDRLAAIALSTALQAAARPKGPHARLVLTNGCRLDLVSASVSDERRLVGKSPFGAMVAVPLEKVVALELYGSRATYLSDLVPLSYVADPFLDLSWPLGRDETPAGTDLILAGETFDKGIGLHAGARVTYDLAGNYDRFEALVGLDGRIGQLGRVRLEILVDDRPQVLGAAALRTGPQRPLALTINVRGARRLTLAVRREGRGDVQANVDWADARLIGPPRKQGQ